MRTLLLDVLSFINDSRWQQVLKTISQNYQNPLDADEVFRKDLKNLVERENITNNFINEALRNKAHVSNQSNTRKQTMRRSGKYIWAPGTEFSITQNKIIVRERLYSRMDKLTSLQKQELQQTSIAKEQDNEIIEQEIRIMIQKGIIKE
ncbi:1419_t:CDS:2, partial [Racocetra persica]